MARINISLGKDLLLKQSRNCKKSLEENGFDNYLSTCDCLFEARCWLISFFYMLQYIILLMTS